jgi:hypothetical protein
MAGPGGAGNSATRTQLAFSLLLWSNDDEQQQSLNVSNTG